MIIAWDLAAGVYLEGDAQNLKNTAQTIENSAVKGGTQNAT